MSTVALLPEPPALPAPTRTEPSPPPAITTLPIHRVSAEEYERWISLGALGPEDKVELLDGYIIDKLDHLPAHFRSLRPDEMPDGLLHARALRRITHHFSRLAADRWVTQNQSAVRLGGPSRPEPDVAMLRPPVSLYDDRRPGPADILLLVEVSETSLVTDRGDKLRAYARAGIPEYWIVNLPGRIVEVHRDPEPEAARYRSVRPVTAGDLLAPAAFPDATLVASELFG